MDKTIASLSIENNLFDYLKKKLDDKRLKHSVNTAEEAVLLAEKYGADKDKAYLAGLLHDIAKCMPPEALLEYALDNGVKIDEFERNNPELIHGKIGAALAQKDLGIEDAEILSAIRWHTTGHADMSLLDKIIYLADIIEPSRKFDDIEKIRELAYKDIDSAMIYCLEHVINFVRKKGFTLHPVSLEAYNYLKNKGGIF